MLSLIYQFSGKINSKRVNWIFVSMIIHQFRWFGLSLRIKRVIRHVKRIKHFKDLTLPSIPNDGLQANSLGGF